MLNRSHFNLQAKSFSLAIQGIAFTVIISMTACNRQTTVDQGYNEVEISEETLDDIEVQYDTGEENTEYLDWDSLRINGKLSMVCLKRELIKVLGAPDSIAKPDMDKICVSFFADDFEYAYFKGSKFEVHGDSAVVASLNLENIELGYEASQLVLSERITIHDIEGLFPKASKRTQKTHVRGLGKCLLISLPASKRYYDDALYLYFVDGKLRRIDLRLAC